MATSQNSGLVGCRGDLNDDNFMCVSMGKLVKSDSSKQNLCVTSVMSWDFSLMTHILNVTSNRFEKDPFYCCIYLTKSKLF